MEKVKINKKQIQFYNFEAFKRIEPRFYKLILFKKSLYYSIKTGM